MNIIKNSRAPTSFAVHIAPLNSGQLWYQRVKKSQKQMIGFNEKFEFSDAPESRDCLGARLD